MAWPLKGPCNGAVGKYLLGKLDWRQSSGSGAGLRSPNMCHLVWLKGEMNGA